MRHKFIVEIKTIDDHVVFDDKSTIHVQKYDDSLNQLINQSIHWNTEPFKSYKTFIISV